MHGWIRPDTHRRWQRGETEAAGDVSRWRGRNKFMEYGAGAEGGARDNDNVGMARLTSIAWRTLGAEAAGGL